MPANDSSSQSSDISVALLLVSLGSGKTTVTDPDSHAQAARSGIAISADISAIVGDLADPADTDHLVESEDEQVAKNNDAADSDGDNSIGDEDGLQDEEGGDCPPSGLFGYNAVAAAAADVEFGADGRSTNIDGVGIEPGARPSSTNGKNRYQKKYCLA